MNSFTINKKEIQQLLVECKGKINSLELELAKGLSEDRSKELLLSSNLGRVLDNLTMARIVMHQIEPLLLQRNEISINLAMKKEIDELKTIK